MSTKLDALLAFYQKILVDVGVFDANGDGMLSYHDGTKPKAVTISKKRLCLPTKAILKESDWERRIPFHPYSEQINQGPSPVLNALKNYIQIRLKATIREISLALMELAAEPKRHKSLGAKASKFLQGLADADQKTADTLRKMLDAATAATAPDKRLIGMFLKNGGDNGALRTCVVSFPIMDDAYTDDTTEMFGMKMPRKTKDKQIIVSLLDYVLGDQEVRKTYSCGSTDQEAPYFQSLMLSFHKIAKHLNQLIDLHGTACPQIAGFKFNLDWEEELNDPNFARVNGSAIPSLPGNKGLTSDEVIEEAKTSAYEASDEDVGLTTEQEAAPVRERSREVEDRPRTQETSGGQHRTLKDLMNRKRHEEERGGIVPRSWRSQDRDDDRRERSGFGSSRRGGGRSW